MQTGLPYHMPEPEYQRSEHKGEGRMFECPVDIVGQR